MVTTWLVIALVSSCLPSRITAQEADILIPPKSVNVSLVGVAEFNCTGIADDFIWKINGVDVVSNGDSLIQTPTTTLNEAQGIRMSTLRVTDLSTDNATNVTCTAVVESPLSSDKSVPALLMIQGILEPVSDLSVILLNSTTVNISWSPPFTLEGVPILGYNVSVITTGNKETNLVIGTVLYYPLDPNPGNFTVIVVPFNEIGLGGSAAVTYAFNEKASLSTDSSTLAATQVTVVLPITTTITTASVIEPSESVLPTGQGSASVNIIAAIGGSVGVLLLCIILCAVILVPYAVRKFKKKESRTTDQVPPDIILHQFEFTTCELKREQESRRENERIEREKERPEAEKRERTGRQQAEQQRVAIERERLESEEQERQRLEEAELKRRSLASQGTPERQVPPPVRAMPHVHPPPSAPPVMPIMTREEGSLPSTTPASERTSVFESTSMNLLVEAAAVGSNSNMHSQVAFESISIADWLMSYKLSEYVTLFENNGYDNTDFLLGISVEELIELGVTKPGHRKRMMAALNRLLPKEHFLTIKPASVGEWLMQLSLNQYEEVMMESGYDIIDDVSCVTEEELMEIGITKKGHLKRFRKGIQELIVMQKSEPATPSSLTQPYNHLSNLSASSMSHQDSITVSEGDILEPPSAGGSPVAVHVVKEKNRQTSYILADFDNMLADLN